MSIFKEFEKFISRGNVIDLAVGVVIGGAFTTIVNSIVKDILMPILGLLTGGIDFSDKVWVLQKADPAKDLPQVAIQYGDVVQAGIQFIIVAFAVFLLVKGINKLQQKIQSVEATVVGLAKSIDPNADPAPKPTTPEVPTTPTPSPAQDDQQTVELLKEILKELKSKK